MVLLASLGATASGCTTYSNLDTDNEKELDASKPTSDATSPIDGSLSETSLPPPDGGGGVDVSIPDGGGSTDVARDQSGEGVPPVDAPSRDSGNDIATGSDGTAPGTDANLDADTSAPPTTDGSTDVGGRDADAATPPPDADAGPVDVRDSGPTCWGTPSTHDEDNDGVVDECDNCPSIANANQADVGEINAGQTADGVGDACDPRPSAGGDGIFFFDGINFTTFPAEWTNVGTGSWTASGTTMTPTGTATGQELKRSFPSTLGNYLVETSFTFTALTSPGSASIPFRTDASRNGWGCGVGIGSSGGDVFLTQVTGGTGETTPTTTPITDPQVGNRFRLLAGGFNSSLYCMTGSTRINRPGTTTTGESGVRASSASATFEYLLVYKLGGTIP